MIEPLFPLPPLSQTYLSTRTHHSHYDGQPELSNVIIHQDMEIDRHATSLKSETAVERSNSKLDFWECARGSCGYMARYSFGHLDEDRDWDMMKTQHYTVRICGNSNMMEMNFGRPELSVVYMYHLYTVFINEVLVW